MAKNRKIADKFDAYFQNTTKSLQINENSYINLLTVTKLTRSKKKQTNIETILVKNILSFSFNEVCLSQLEREPNPTEKSELMGQIIQEWTK